MVSWFLSFWFCKTLKTLKVIHLVAFQFFDDLALKKIIGGHVNCLKVEINNKSSNKGVAEDVANWFQTAKWSVDKTIFFYPSPLWKKSSQSKRLCVILKRLQHYNDLANKADIQFTHPRLNSIDDVQFLSLSIIFLT